MSRARLLWGVPVLALAASCGGNAAPATAARNAARAPVATESVGVAVSAAAACDVFGANSTACLSAAPNPVRRDSAALALGRGLMPLGSTGIRHFASAHPQWDGRGVLIAIMDSGIDPAIPGLGTTSDGAPKVIDLRDFSGEGRVALQRAVRRGDTLFVGNRRLLGASTVAAVAGDTPIWGGALYELGLGKAPAADLNGNGIVGDTLIVVVAKTSVGWALFADTDGNGTLAGERPIHDYLVGHEVFSWHQAGAGPVHLAANFADSADVPILDLFFDTSSHGTHVSGIAAGHDIYGVPEFDGVAPGAKLIGLKISNDAHGPVSVTGAMVRALDYAIRFAAARSMPLVVNLSFGVGNELEGTARIDAAIDSILAAHPDVVMTIAAGNDGPGLSTLGFPASAGRAIAVGATLPALFMGGPPGDAAAEMVAPFSSRGGEVNGPDITVPGAAYSTVPNYAMGNELENGTSMASPYAAGLAARLLSAAHATGRAPSAELVRQALRMGAHSLPAAFRLDQGAGLPDLDMAWSWLGATHDYSELAVEVGLVKSRGAVFLTAPVGAGPHALGERVVLHRLDGVSSMTVRLVSDATWLQLPETVTLSQGRGSFTVAVRPDAYTTPGVLQGVIRVEGADETAGPLAVIPVTVRVPVPATGTRTPLMMHQSAGGNGRVFIPADTGRGMQLEVATLRNADHLAAALHEPGGMPFRDDRTLAAGFGDGAGVFDVDASDVASGIYELDVQGSAFGPTDAKVTVRQSPLRLGAVMLHDTLLVTARNMLATPLPVRLRAGLIGGDRRITVRGAGAAVRVAIPVPRWADRTVIDSRMAPESWGRFTDFGLSFLDRHGREFDSSPINYAFSRAVPTLPDSVVGDTLFLLLSPGFADSLDHAPWTLDLDVRFYVEKPFSLDAGGSAMKTVAGKTTREERFVPGPIPIAFPADCVPLITIVGLEGTERIWTRETTPTRSPGAHP